MGKQGLGGELEFGIVPATTWHTAVALDAGSKIKVNQFGPLQLQQTVVQDETMGRSWARRVDRGQITQELTFSGPLRYENAQFVHLFQLIGAETGSVSTGVYTHYADCETEIDGHMYTAAAIIRDTTLGSSELFEWPSVKPISWELTKGNEGFVEFTCTGIADTFLNESNGEDNSVINTTTTVGTTSTYDTETLLVPFGHCRVNLNAQAGADFNASGDGTDVIKPTSVTISVNRPLERDFNANRLSSDSGDADTYKTDEPVQSGRFHEIYLTLEFGELDNDNWIDYFRGDTALKAEVQFYSTANRYIKFQFPHIKIYEMTVDPSGINRIPQAVTFQAMEVPDGSTAPTGMTGITTPMRMTVVNSWASKYDTGAAIT